MRYSNIKLLSLIALFSIICFVNLNENKVDYDAIRALHKDNIEKSPFKNTKNLSKSKRKELQLPPNPYNERLWELTMDPVLGRPRTENLFQIQDELYQKSLYPVEGVPGENPDMAWVARGPSNVAGRTNGMMFDPNDATNKRVFAGGVSGGIFVNDENAISSVASVLDQSKDQVKLGAKGPIYLRLINSSLPGEVEIDLGESFPINPQIRGAIKSLNGVVEVEEL